MKDLICSAAVYVRDRTSPAEWRLLGRLVMSADPTLAPFKRNRYGRILINGDAYRIGPELPPGTTLKKLLTCRAPQE